MAKIPRKFWLYLTLAILLLASAAIWYIWPDVGSNLFAEASGIVITVVVIDRLLQWERDAHLAPARLAAFRDAMEVSREAREFLLAMARSSVPHRELSRVQGEAGVSPSPWLAEYCAQISPERIAPYGAPPPYGNGYLHWRDALPMQVVRLRSLIERYMQRHTAHGDPSVTEAVHDFEENGLFRSMSYGMELFWLLQRPASMFEHFIAKLSKLIEVTDRSSGKYAGANNQLSATSFEWHRLAIEIEENPTAREQAPWRPGS